MRKSWELSLEAEGVTPGGGEGGDPHSGWYPGTLTPHFKRQRLPEEAQGGCLTGSGTHLILAQGVLVLSWGWPTHGNSTALWFYVCEWCNAQS